MTDLVVTMFTPTLGSGRALRTYAIVRALSQLGGVEVLYPVFGAPAPSPEYEALEGVVLHPTHSSRGVGRALTYARARLAQTPAGFARGISRELVSAANRWSETHQGRVIADGPTAAAALTGLARRRPVIYSAHNLESAFRAEVPGSRHELGSRRSLARFEAKLLDTMAESWMASPLDVDRARALRPGARLRYVPNVIDTASVRPLPAAPPRRRVLFLADFSYGPNVDALELLLGEVMPRVWSRLPDARLVLAGRGLALPATTDGRVESLGFVDHVADAYAAADCCVVPLRHSGGTPLKFIEALAYGMPVVSTPLAAAGLDVSPGEHYIEADGGPALANALCQLLERGDPDLGRRGRELAERCYSIESLSARLAA